MFLHQYGEAFRNNRLTDPMKKYIEQAGIDKLVACHIFRHIQAIPGHSQLSTTEIYTHVSIRKLKEMHALTHPADRVRRRQGKL